MYVHVCERGGGMQLIFMSLTLPSLHIQLIYSNFEQLLMSRSTDGTSKMGRISLVNA